MLAKARLILDHDKTNTVLVVTAANDTFNK